MSFVDVAIAVGIGATAGAGLGAITSAISGGDVGKGALFGALGGGLTGGVGEGLGAGISGLVTGAGEETAAASPAVLESAVQQTGADALGTLGEVPNLSTVGGATESGVTESGITQPMLDSQGMPIASDSGSLVARSDMPIQDTYASIKDPTTPQTGFTQGMQQSLNQEEAGGLQRNLDTMARNAAAKPSSGIGGFLKDNPMLLPAGMMAMPMLDKLFGPNYSVPQNQKYSGALSKFHYDPSQYTPTYAVPQVYTPHYAEGGLASLAQGGGSSMMGSKNEHLDFMHNSAFPMSQQDNLTFNTPTQMPAGAQNVASQYEVSTNPLTGEPTAKFAEGGTVGGPVAWFGQSLNNPNSPLGQAFQAHLGASGKASMPPPPFDPNTQAAHFDPSAFKVSVTSPSIAKPYTPKYAAGGELLKGPGDGVSDDIPATIGGRQPAKLSEGEFVVPARIVSELGNGSTDAGAKRLYAMMDRIQKQRGKTMGKKGFSKDSRAERALPV